MSDPSAHERAPDERAQGESRAPTTKTQEAAPVTQRETSDPPSAANSAVLRVRSGPLAGPLLTRVVAMMLARAECPVDRLDDAMLICDALTAHAGAHAADGRLEFTVLTRVGGMELRVGALSPGGAHRLAQATTLPGVGDVLEPIADEVRVEAPTTGVSDELVLELGFSRTSANPRSNAAAGQAAGQAGAHAAAAGGAGVARRSGTPAVTDQAQAPPD